MTSMMMTVHHQQLLCIRSKRLEHAVSCPGPNTAHLSVMQYSTGCSTCRVPRQPALTWTVEDNAFSGLDPVGPITLSMNFSYLLRTSTA
jgi:hypothetical protein